MSVEDFVDNLINYSDLDAALSSFNSVKFTVSLSSLDNKRLENVCSALFQKRATFSADAIMEVVKVAEKKLGFLDENYLPSLIEELRTEGDKNE